MMRVFSINHGHLNILYEYNSRAIFVALSNGSTLRGKSSLYLRQQSSPGLSSEKRFEGGWWAIQDPFRTYYTSSWGSHSPLPQSCALSLALHQLWGRWWGGPQGQRNTGLTWSQAAPPAPDPTWFVSHNKEKKLCSSFLVIPSQRTYSPFTLWKIS